VGQATNRGTREERIAQAQAAGRKPGAPERTKPYQFRMPRSTPALDKLWPLFKPFVNSDKTIGEIRAEAVAEQQRLAAEREARADA
jgi:hypothetical protein